jgi:regulator of sigma E protease
LDPLSLIPTFGSLAWTVAAFVLALSVIVAVHEYGHYIVGRWCGIHAETFSLGFGPVLWSGHDRRGTRWQVAALPFGGYVKFAGDANAASAPDGEAVAQMTAAERRRTMPGAPLWARSLTVAAGPLFNFALSILIFAGYFAVVGIATDTPTVGSLKPTPFQGDSLLPGDRITALNGTATPDFEAFVTVARALPPAAAATYAVDRDGSETVVDGPYPFPPIADGVQPQSAAQAADLAEGDVITAVDGTPVYSFTQLRDIVGASEGRPLNLTVWRAGESFAAVLEPRRQDLPVDGGGFETRWLIGLSGGLVFVPEVRRVGAGELAGLAVGQTWEIITTSLSGIAHIVSGAISSCNIQGPIGIAETSGAMASQGFDRFVLFIAMLSTAVGMMNLFPIPVLDGGHLVFHAWEAVTRRPPGDRAVRALMSVGLALLLGLMAFALFNDLFCP